MTPEQRRKFFACIDDIRKQVPWPVNGELVAMHKDDWKLVFCAALVKETRIAQGLEGGHVVLGLRLRDIFAGLKPDVAIALAGDLITLVEAFGAEHNVKWSKEVVCAQ